ncbi:acyl-CoA N-acyltransferase [Lentithecium fluviatile CBS 122367]|uniref:Acyl-CoA N-acyltransferase n=1 Tax=Lentithecium fluviatile CBS 122367 TaxID=1168545 RepID=A0A6G1J500_9PLEO|nr:acyl-CoA N-acyltransferase [Lentithecium fluviatile CBS 122367]
MAQPTPAHPSTLAAQLAAQLDTSPDTASTPAPTQPIVSADSPLPNPIITTPRLLIRAMHPQDAPSMAHHAGPASITQYMSLAFAHPYTLQHAETWIALNLKDHLDNYTICLPSNPSEPIGGIGVKPGSDVQSHTAEIGYWISEEHQGKGLVSEALGALTEWVFGEGKLNDGRKVRRLFAGVFGGNEASMRVLEKNGYRAEGVFKGHVEKHGVIRDMHWFGVTKDDWLEWKRSQS